MKTPVTEQIMLSENKTYMILTYIFFILGFNVMPVLGPVIGVAMAYAKRSEVFGTFYYDHLTWLIKTFWISFWLTILGFITTIILVGYLILFLIFCWTVFRVIYGLIRLLNKQDVNPYSCFM